MELNKHSDTIRPLIAADYRVLTDEGAFQNWTEKELVEFIEDRERRIMSSKFQEVELKLIPRIEAYHSKLKAMHARAESRTRL